MLVPGLAIEICAYEVYKGLKYHCGGLSATGVTSRRFEVRHNVPLLLTDSTKWLVSAFLEDISARPWVKTV